VSIWGSYADIAPIRTALNKFLDEGARVSLMLQYVGSPHRVIAFRG